MINSKIFLSLAHWLRRQLSLACPWSMARTNKSSIAFGAKGTKLGWLIEPEDESVTIFYPDRLPEIKEGEEILPVLSVLENWQLTSTEMFDWLKL